MPAICVMTLIESGMCINDGHPVSNVCLSLQRIHSTGLDTFQLKLWFHLTPLLLMISRMQFFYLNRNIIKWRKKKIYRKETLIVEKCFEYLQRPISRCSYKQQYKTKSTGKKCAHSFFVSTIWYSFTRSSSKLLGEKSWAACSQQPSS